MSLTSSPKLIKGGLVVLAPGGGAVQRMIALQYNPDTLTRSYQVQGVGGDGGGERAQPFRLKGPAIETIKLDAEIDATDQLEFPDSNANAVAFGIAPQLAVLEALVNPSVDELLAVAAQSASGTLEILPPEAPLVLFVWSKSRVVPVRVTEFSITEEAFDPGAQPDPRQGQPRPARAEHRRSRLHPPGRHASSSAICATREALAAKAGSAIAGVARPHQPARDGDDAMTSDPVQLLIEAGAIPGQSVRAEQPLSRRRRSAATCAAPAIPASPTCCAASSRRRATSAIAGEHIVRRRRAARPARRADSATPSCTGASPTPMR